jgi:hypothetical protein
MSFPKKTENETLPPNTPLAMNCAMTFEAADVVAGIADGKATLPRFSMVAYTGGPMRVGGWRYPVVMDLAGLAIPSQMRPIRMGHDAMLGVGHTDSIRVEAGQLIATGSVRATRRRLAKSWRPRAMDSPGRRPSAHLSSSPSSFARARTSSSTGKNSAGP